MSSHHPFRQTMMARLTIFVAIATLLSPAAASAETPTNILDAPSAASGEDCLAMTPLVPGQDMDTQEKERLSTFEWHDDMSILDVLNPDLLEHDEAMADIRDSLHAHKLVVIRDAFRPDFAEYVWAELYRDDLDWPQHTEFVDNGFGFSHHNFYGQEVRYILRVFDITSLADNNNRPYSPPLTLAILLALCSQLHIYCSPTQPL